MANASESTPAKAKINPGPTPLENYAVIRTGGKQYTVTPGQTIKISKLDGEIGSSVTFAEVLLVSPAGSSAPTIGMPMVNGAKVTATITEQFRDKKVVIFKKRRRKGYTKKQGHRQDLTRVRIEAING